MIGAKIIYEKNYNKLYFVMAVYICIIFILSASPKVAVAEDIRNIMTEQLVEKLLTLENEDKLDIVLWHLDIDYAKVEENTLKETGLTEELITEDLSIESVQNYISIKRQYAKQEYIIYNNSFFEKNLSNLKETIVLFKSEFSPVFILNTTKSNILSLAKNSNVTFLDYFQNSESVLFSDIANVNSGSAYLRDTGNQSGINATGNNVKIGIIENNIPDKDYQIFVNDGNELITYNVFNCNKFHELTPDNDYIHATLAAAIMVGQEVVYQGQTYKGIAPDADLYCAYANTMINFYNRIEDMINYDVNIINFSCGFTSNEGEYDSFAKWIDHIAFMHDVHIVAATGNNTSNVATPAIAYNVIAVGSFNDNNHLIGSYAPSSIGGNSQELNSNFTIVNDSNYVTNSGIYKPDVLASGEIIRFGDIDLGNGYSYNSGTSFAAPQITAQVAQLCQLYPAMLTNNSGIKAILAASAIFRVHDTAYVDLKDTNSELFLKQGAGIANVRCAEKILYAGKRKDITLSGNTHYYTFTINVPSNYTYLRLAMSWIKRNSISGNHTNSNNYSYQDLADLKLELYYGSVSNGTRVALSDTAVTNLELLQYTIPSGHTGTYTVRVINKDYTSGLGYQYISLAWY